MANRSGSSAPWSSRKKSDKVDLNKVFAALSLVATVFFGSEAIQNRNQSAAVDSGESVSQKCQSFYMEMDALNDAGLSVEGLAHIEDPRERVCGPAHAVPYIWDISPQTGEENPQENQPNEEASVPDE